MNYLNSGYQLYGYLSTQGESVNSPHLGILPISIFFLRTDWVLGRAGNIGVSHKRQQFDFHASTSVRIEPAVAHSKLRRLPIVRVSEAGLRDQLTATDRTSVTTE